MFMLFEKRDVSALTLTARLPIAMLYPLLCPEPHQLVFHVERFFFVNPALLLRFLCLLLIRFHNPVKLLRVQRPELGGAPSPRDNPGFVRAFYESGFCFFLPLGSSSGASSVPILSRTDCGIISASSDVTAS